MILNPQITQTQFILLNFQKLIKLLNLNISL